MISKETLKAIKAIEIKTRQNVNTTVSGQYHSAFRGRGINFSQVREYTSEDDHRRIDWKVTARTGSPYIKEFQEERELVVILAVDVSQSMNFGSSVQTKREKGAEMAAVLIFSAIRNADKVGLLLFSDETELWIPPKKGKKHGLRLIRELLYVNPKQKKTGIRRAITQLMQVLNRKSIVFLMSDFQDEGYENSLKALGKKHDVIPIMIEDRREKTWPKYGAVVLEDAESGEIFTLNTKKLKAIEAQYQEKRNRLDALFKGLKMVPLWIETAQPYLNQLMQFFDMRMRKR